MLWWNKRQEITFLLGSCKEEVKFSLFPWRLGLFLPLPPLEVAGEEEEGDSTKGCGSKELFCARADINLQRSDTSPSEERAGGPKKKSYGFWKPTLMTIPTDR